MIADADHPPVDPDLVAAWVTGWAMSRQAPTPVRDRESWRVDVGAPDQTARFVFPRLSDDVRRRAQEITAPFVFLKVCAPEHLVRSLLPPRWEIRGPGFMMGLPGIMVGQAKVPAGYRAEIVDNAAMRTVRICGPNGDEAAHGNVALVGDMAVYDRILTHEDHRRRGLGRAVMKVLEADARARGATRGMLVATTDGRALYETLGWRMLSLYTTAAIPDD